MAHPSGSQNWTSWIVEQYRQQRGMGLSTRDAWRVVKEQFAQSYQQQYPAGDIGQAWKVLSGKALEQIVAQEFQNQIQQAGLGQQTQIQHWDQVRNPLVKQILSESLWLRGELQEPYLAESKVDFIAMELQNGQPVRVVAVYSCKASLAERFQQDLFWADRLRGRGIRFCLITLDNAGVLHEAIQTGQLTRKEAKMAASLYDRVYLLSDESIQRFTRVFRTIDLLAEDLKRWLEAG